MPERDDLPVELIALFAEQLQVEVASASTDLIEAGLLDSAKFVELLVCLEQKLRIHLELSELEIDQFRSVARIAELVHSKIPSQRQENAVGRGQAPEIRSPGSEVSRGQ